MRRILFLLLTCIIVTSSVFAQSENLLRNGSFEDVPRAGGSGFPFPITDWIDVGRIVFPMETSPDIHGLNTNFWGVTTRPYDGATFLGLVTRPHGTYESIAQLLPTPLLANEMYHLSLFLCQDPGYKSPIKPNPGSRTPELIPFTNPVILRIWGGDEVDPYVLLGESEPVDHPEWREYSFVLTPNEDLPYLILEAYYPSDAKEHVAGHVMIDKMELWKY